MGRASFLFRCPTLAQPPAAGKFDSWEDFAGFSGTADNMMEQSTLSLRPWNSPRPGEPGGQVQAIVDGAGETVGFVRQPPPRTPRWLNWLSRRTIEVYEAPDGSLVFALRRAWGWRGGWQLLDADERLVGTLRGRVMLDGFGHFLAAIEPADKAGHARFLALEGSELGEYALDRNGAQLTFAPALQGNPFAKMLLLGAVLVGLKGKSKK
jgi:hypothetical protein